MPAIKLFISCPAEECGNEDKTKKHWIHNNCGGNTMIDIEQLQISCSKCTKKAIIFQWKFACKAHTFRQGSLQGWLHSISTMSQSETNQATLMLAVKKVMELYQKQQQKKEAQQKKIQKQNELKKLLLGPKLSHIVKKEKKEEDDDENQIVLPFARLFLRRYDASDFE